MQEAPEVKASPKKKKEKQVPAAPTVDGMVLYADAGVKPNPGFGGWGVHGYTFCLTQPKKGSGNPYAIPTADGYVMKSVAKEDRSPEITPLQYFDGFAAVRNITNNCGELLAATNAFELAERKQVPYVKVLTDSQYVIKGSLEQVQRWSANGWKKLDGQPIQNLQEWQAMDRVLNSLREKDIKFDLVHVKGHSGNLGNSTVDEYATQGRLLAIEVESKTHITHTQPEGYWGPRYEKHPFFHHPRSYLTTRMTGEELNEYFVGFHGREIDVVGKRDADASYAYLLLKEKQELLEIVKRRVTSIATRDDTMVMVHMDQLYERNTATRVFNFVFDALSRTDLKRLDLVITKDGTRDGEPVVTELNPPRIAHRTIEAINTLKGVLLDWRDNPNTNLAQTDITDLLYKTNEKGEKEIGAEYGVGVVSLKTKANVKTTTGFDQHEVKLTLGVDLPDRNSLKKIERADTKVFLVTWNVSANAFRYATVVSSDGDLGIWAGFYANTALLKESPNSSTLNVQSENVPS